MVAHTVPAQGGPASAGTPGHGRPRYQYRHRKIASHMPLTQLPMAMMKPKTIKVTRPTNSAYSIREAPRSSRQRSLSKTFQPHTIEVLCITRV